MDTAEHDEASIPPIIPLPPIRSVSRIGKFVIVASIISCLAGVAFFSRRTSLLQVVSLPFVCMLLAALIVGVIIIFTEWPQRRWRAIIPLAVCLVAIFVSGMLVQTVRDFLFRWALPSYEAVVHQLQTGILPVSASRERIPVAETTAKLTYRVFAQKDTNGILNVEFWTEDGFPVKHSGYLYLSSGTIEPGSSIARNWPFYRQLKTNWFYISD